MSNANGGTPAGKVRPAWMGGTTAGEEPVTTAPTTEEKGEEAAGEQAYEQFSDEQTGPEVEQAPLEKAPVKPEPQPEPEPEPEPERGGGHESPSPSTTPDAPSSGKKNLDVEDREQNTYPRPANSAPTGIKEAIQGFVERISGKRQAPSGNASGVSSEAEEARGPTEENPQEIEREVLRSLRDTGIEGFCRLAFGSPKGGVGKSSIAYAVAGAIAYFTNLRVCLVDCDPDFGATRYMVPHPLDYSVLDLAEDAEKLERLADLRGYVSQNKHMGLDILLNPVQAAQISTVEDLARAYERVDGVLQQFYDLVVFDLGSGFRDEAIRRLLSLSDELVLVSDSEKIPNGQLPDALNYVEGLGIDLARTTLCINHGRRPSEESEDTAELRRRHSHRLRSITEVEYDPDFSRLLNDREFHPASLALMTRLGVLTTAGVSLQGLRRDAYQRAREKVISIGSENGHHKGES